MHLEDAIHVPCHSIQDTGRARRTPSARQTRKHSNTNTLHTHATLIRCVTHTHTHTRTHTLTHTRTHAHTHTSCHTRCTSRSTPKTFALTMRSPVRLKTPRCLATCICVGESERHERKRRATRAGESERNEQSVSWVEALEGMCVLHGVCLACRRALGVFRRAVEEERSCDGTEDV
jgi:hypothetical protein